MANVNNLTRSIQLTSSIILRRLQTINGLTATTGGITKNNITEIYCSTGSRIYCLRFKILRDRSMLHDVTEISPSRNTRNTTTINKIKGIMRAFEGRSVTEGTIMYG